MRDKNQDQGKIIFAESGHIILQLGSYAHSYEDAEDAATDLYSWICDSDTADWEGHDELAAEIDPTWIDILQNGTYRVLHMDKESNSMKSIIKECGDIGWKNASMLADQLKSI